MDCVNHHNNNAGKHILVGDWSTLHCADILVKLHLQFYIHHYKSSMPMTQPECLLHEHIHVLDVRGVCTLELLLWVDKQHNDNIKRCVFNQQLFYKHIIPTFTYGFTA